MKRDAFLYVGGCTGSFPSFSESRLAWDPGAPWSIALTSFRRERYGGRTTNYLLRFKDTYILIDHGLGIELSSRFLLSIFQREQPEHPLVYVVQTHYHIDHIHGTTQNHVLYPPGMRLRYFSPDLPSAQQHGVSPDTPFMEHILRMYFNPSGAYFPVSLDRLGSTREHERFQPGATLQLGDIVVHTQMLNHPGGCCGYRFELPGNRGAVVVATDFEPPEDPERSIVDFFDGAHLILSDMQYDAEEYAGTKALGGLKLPRKTWGHATPDLLFPYYARCKKAPAQIRIVHHDPGRSDAELDLFYQHSCNVLETLSPAGRFDYAFACGGDLYWL